MSEQPDEEEKTYSLEELLGEDEEESDEQQKPFGDERITEDEAVSMDKE